MPTTLAVTGNYGQMTSFVKGLDSFPRLFIIQTFNLTYGTTSPSADRDRPSGGIVCGLRDRLAIDTLVGGRISQRAFCRAL